MRIGILTLPLHTNYGGILQAYALQTVLEKMGHEVVVFDTPNKTLLPPLWKMPLSFGKRTLKKILGRTDRIFVEHYQNKIRPVIAKNIQPFIDGKIHRKVIKNFHQLSQADYDAIIVGSDQVWRAVYFHMWLGQDVENGYLLFAKYLMLPLLALLFGSILMNKHKYVNCCLKNLMQYLLENQMVWSYVKSILI